MLSKKVSQCLSTGPLYPNTTNPRQDDTLLKPQPQTLRALNKYPKDLASQQEEPMSPASVNTEAPNGFQWLAAIEL